MTAVQRVCSECGTAFAITDRGARCPTCRPPDRRTAGRRYRPRPSEAGYDHRWRALSERARRAQPFCLDCGTTDDLTTDHTPEAWARVEAGKVLRLSDVAVVCRACNARRGAARGESVGDGRPGLEARRRTDPRRVRRLP